jgi:hypothetical protein
MPGWLIGLIVVAGLFLIGGTLFTVTSDKIRRRDPARAEDMDEMAATMAARAALPMHDHAFDHPKDL